MAGNCYNVFGQMSTVRVGGCVVCVCVCVFRVRACTRVSVFSCVDAFADGIAWLTRGATIPCVCVQLVPNPTNALMLIGAGTYVTAFLSIVFLSGWVLLFWTTRKVCVHACGEIA